LSIGNGRRTRPLENVLCSVMQYAYHAICRLSISIPGEEVRSGKHLWADDRTGGSGESRLQEVDWTSIHTY